MNYSIRDVLVLCPAAILNIASMAIAERHNVPVGLVSHSPMPPHNEALVFGHVLEHVFECVWDLECIFENTLVKNTFKNKGLILKTSWNKSFSNGLCYDYDT